MIKGRLTMTTTTHILLQKDSQVSPDPTTQRVIGDSSDHLVRQEVRQIHDPLFHQEVHRILHHILEWISLQGPAEAKGNLCCGTES